MTEVKCKCGVKFDLDLEKVKTDIWIQCPVCLSIYENPFYDYSE